MSQIEELAPVVLGKGVTLRLFIDHSKALNDPDHNYSEVNYDGEEGSLFFEAPPHWHKIQDEVMEMRVGRMKFTIDGKENILSAGDPPFLISHGQVHSIKVFKRERAILREKTLPSGDYKALFFHDFYQDGPPTFAMTMRAFYDGDTYVPLPGNIKLLDELFTTIVGFVSKAFVPAKLRAVKRKGEEGRRDS